MRHHNLHLIGAAAALAVALGPAMSATASADEQGLPESTASAAPAAVEQAEQTDPAPPAESTEPSPMATDDVTPTPSETVSDPVLKPEESSPVAPRDGKPSAEARGEDGHEGGGHGEGGTLPEGVTVTVDGRDITSTDPAESLPKIAGCSFEVTVSGLATDPPDAVGIRIIAWPPTAPEENKVVLVDVTEESADGSWAGSYPLDEAVEGFKRVGNGYHMRFEVFVNGQKGAMKMYWLGCGEPQTGNPRRMLFDATWFDAAGAEVTGDLDTALPSGWRQDFALTASGERGTATCTYPRGSVVLTCVYDNPGHGDQPGLVLPGKPGTDYRVAVEGVPDGWRVDTATVGVFLADDTCPKGHDDGHSDDPDHADSVQRDDDGDHATREPCVHTVVLNGTDSGEGTEPAQPPDDEADDGTDDEESAAAAALPMTGTPAALLLLVAVSLAGVGVALAVSARSRRAPSTPAGSPRPSC